MYIIIDIVLFAIIAICMIIGWIKGFFDQIISLFSGIIAFFAAYFVTPLIAPFISEHLFFTKISEKAAELIYGLENNAAELFTTSKANETFRNILERFGADYDAIQTKFADSVAQQTDKALDGIATHIAELVSYALSYALCFIIIFVLVLVALWLIKHLLKLTEKLPVIKQANKVLGLVVGGVLGIIIVWVLSVMIKLGLPYLNVVAPTVFTEDLFEKSIILKLTYYLNAVRAMIDFSYIKKLIGV